MALHASWSAALAEGAIAEDLARRRPRCLIFIGAADADFLDGARRAASEIPNAQLLVVGEADHDAAYMSQDEVVLDAVLPGRRACEGAGRAATAGGSDGAVGQHHGRRSVGAGLDLQRCRLTD